MRMLIFICLFSFQAPVYGSRDNAQQQQNDEASWQMAKPNRLKQKQEKREAECKAQEAARAAQLAQRAAQRAQKEKKDRALITQEANKRAAQLQNPKPKIAATQSLVSPLDGDAMWGESVFRAGPSCASYPPYATLYFKYAGHATHTPALEEKIEARVTTMMAHYAEQKAAAAAAAPPVAPSIYNYKAFPPLPGGSESSGQYWR